MSGDVPAEAGQEPVTSFQPAVTWIPARIKELRIDHPDVCWRPNSTWKNVCIKELGHDALCGWEYEQVETIRCRTWVDDGSEDGVACVEPVAFLVHGMPGYDWSGYHCRRHAEEMRGSYNHQGGCVLEPVTQMGEAV